MDKKDIVPTNTVNLPKGWCTVALQDIVESFKRGPFGSAIKKSFFVSKGYKVYQQQNSIYDDPVAGSYFIDEQKYEDLLGFKVKPRDFIVSCSGTIGKISRLPQDTKPGVINQALLRIDLNENIFNSDLFLHLFRSYFFQNLILKETRGSAMKNIAGVKDLKLVPVNLPPFREQARILDKIEELFSDLDDGIKSLKTAQQQIKVYRQAVLKWAFEGKLTAEWREEQRRLGMLESADVLLEKIRGERSQRYQNALTVWKKEIDIWEADGKAGIKPKKPNKRQEVLSLNLYKDKADDLPIQPRSWRWIYHGQILEDIEAGKSFRCEERPPRKNEVGVAKVSAVTWGEYDESESKTCVDETKVNRHFFIKKGDFLFTRANTLQLIGACVIAKKVSLDVMLSDKTLRFRYELQVSSEFSMYYLRSQQGRKEIESLATGNQESMRNIWQNRIRLIRLPLPSSKEQIRIVEEIEARFSVCDQLESNITIDLEKAEALRQSILQQAFEGKLVPQDPNDEPAAVLLERIRAEKALKAAPKKEQRRPSKTWEKSKETGEQLALEDI